MLAYHLLGSAAGGRRRRYSAASGVANLVPATISGPGLTQNIHGVEEASEWEVTPDSIQRRWKSDGVVISGQTEASIANPPAGSLTLEERAIVGGSPSTWAASNAIQIYAPPSVFLFREAITENDTYFGQGALEDKPGFSRMLVEDYVVPEGYRLSPRKDISSAAVLASGAGTADLFPDEIWTSQFPNNPDATVWGAPALSTIGNEFVTISTPISFVVGEAEAATVPATATDENFSMANSPSVSADKLSVSILAVPTGDGIYRAQYQLSTNGGSSWGSTTTLPDYVVGTYIVDAPAVETLTNIRMKWSNFIGDGEWSTDSVTATPGYALSAYVIGSLGSFTFTISGDATIDITEPANLVGTYAVDVSDLASGPVNLVAPAITGTIAQSSLLTSDDGAWIWNEANGALTLTRQWTDGADANLSGQTAVTHTITNNDLNNGLKLRTTGTDGAGNRSVTVSLIGAGDTTAPTLSSAVDDADGDTGATGSVTTNEGNGILYAVVTTSAQAPTTGAKVKLGQREDGAAAVASNSFPVTATGVRSVSFSGLTAETAYAITYFHEDAAGNGSNVITANGFTTEATPGGGFSEQMVIVPVGTYLNRSSSIGSNGPNHLFFMSGVTTATTRQVVASITANSNMFGGIWNGTGVQSVRQTLRTLPNDNTLTNSSTNFPTGTRWSMLSCSYLDGGIVRRQIAYWLAGATDPILLENDTHALQTELWFDTGIVRLFQGTTGSQSYDGQIARVALWLAPTNMPTDLTSSGTAWGNFMLSSTSINDPDVSISEYGAPVVDWGGHIDLTRLNNGEHDGSLGTFIKTGSDFSYA